MNRRKFLFGVIPVSSFACGRRNKANYRADEGLVRKVPSVNALRDLNGPTDGMEETIIAEGYATAGDGGGGIFAWNKSAIDTPVSSLIIKPNGIKKAGRYIRIFNGPIKVKWFGAKGDGVTDDTDVILEALIYLLSKGAGTLYFPTGEYRISSTLLVPRGVNIVGDSYDSSSITQMNALAAVINMTNPQPENTFSDSHIRDIKLQGGSYGGIAGVERSSQNGIFFRFERVWFYGNGIQFQFNSAWMAHFKSCKFEAPLNKCVGFSELSNGAFYNSIHFEGCWFYPKGAPDCVVLPTGNNSGITFDSRCIFESYPTDGLTNYAITMNNCYSELHCLTIRECYFEGFAAERIKLSSHGANSNIIIDGNIFSTPASNNSSIIAPIAGAKIVNNYGLMDKGTNASPI